jgi:asparagine synthetase B (glutamine-hydrolysing)
MCGIFGLSCTDENIKFKSDVFHKLGINSESRGKDASGIAFSGSFHVFKSRRNFSSKFKNKLIFDELTYSYRLKKLRNEYISVIGHTRLATNGSAELDSNNQPVVLDELIGIHNGIICNLDALNRHFEKVITDSDLDSELLFRCLAEQYKATNKINDESDRWLESIKTLFPLLEGAASIAFITKKNSLYLATNTGSLYIKFDKTNFIFSSEKIFLEETLKNSNLLSKGEIIKIEPNTAISLIINETGSFDLKTKKFDKPLPFSESKSELIINIPSSYINFIKSDSHKRRINEIQQRNSLIQRCSMCILPASHPFISFDEKGVCNYCRNYKKIDHLPETLLLNSIEKIKSNSSGNNCIVPLSGGRDSVYVLHVVKEILGLKPVAYTYDWGLVTDLARRNQSRVTQALGIEHIVVSADIKQKRQNVRKNVSAWLKTPDLGIIPLFMAGDKMFFTHANELRKKLNIDTVFFGMNEFENNDFKEGFCNVNKLKFIDGERFYHMSTSQQISMILHYGKQFIKNPRYLNESLIDTVKAYSAYYIADHDYTLLYKYFPWHEKTIEETIIKNYNFELSPDTDSSWRIGDGTASFYNYIYYSLAGFSESEPMRSNQIREGQISREEGLVLAERDNKPRYESFSWYCEAIGLDPVNVMRRIDELPFVENKWK